MSITSLTPVKWNNKSEVSEYTPWLYVRITVGFIYLILIFVILNSISFIFNREYFLLFLLFSIVILSVAGFFLKNGLPWLFSLRQKISPPIVPAGFKAAMVITGQTYTGEVAESGVLRFPFTHHYELFDCRPFQVKLGPCEIQSSDSFKLRGSITSSIRLENIFKSLEINDRQKLIATNMGSALAAAASNVEALRIVANRSDTSTLITGHLNDRLKHYGFVVDYVDVDISETPIELMDDLRKLTVLRNEYAGEDGIQDSDIIDLLLAKSGKISKTTNKIEIPELIESLKILSKR